MQTRAGLGTTVCTNYGRARQSRNSSGPKLIRAETHQGRNSSGEDSMERRDLMKSSAGGLLAGLGLAEGGTAAA
jgi:hypothetical protein